MGRKGREKGEEEIWSGVYSRNLEELSFRQILRSERSGENGKWFIWPIGKSGNGIFTRRTVFSCF